MGALRGAEDKRAREGEENLENATSNILINSILRNCNTFFILAIKSYDAEAKGGRGVKTREGDIKELNKATFPSPVVSFHRFLPIYSP